MIDTHCHLLPGIDDGPSTSADAIELARRLAAQGVDTVLCTPHVSRRYRTDVEHVSRRVDDLREKLDAVGVPLRLAAAGELSLGLALTADPERLVPWRAGRRHLIVDVESTAVPAALEAVAQRFGETGMTPVFAHPERADALRRDPRVLDELRAGGTLIQVVAPSLAGSSGSAVGRAAWLLVEHGRADLLATDAHRAAGALKLQGVLALVGERFGSETVARLTVEAPARLLDA